MFLLLDARAFEIKFYLTVILIKELKREGKRKTGTGYYRYIVAGGKFKRIEI